MSAESVPDAEPRFSSASLRCSRSFIRIPSEDSRLSRTIKVDRHCPLVLYYEVFEPQSSSWYFAVCDRSKRHNRFNAQNTLASEPLCHSGRLAPMDVFRRLLSVLILLAVLGCGSDLEQARKIQSKRQSQMQTQSQQDDLGEVFELLRTFIELNDQKASRQIVYHLNRWKNDRVVNQEPVPAPFSEIRELLPTQQAEERISATEFQVGDITHLRDSYLFRRVLDWADRPESDDPLLAEWLEEQKSILGDTDAMKLRTVARLFDWTVRNIDYEPMELNKPTPPAPGLPFGLTLQGAGYRQTDYLTLWRGIGDALQRAGIFTQLCRQAEIPAFVLARQDNDTGELVPWCVAAMIGEEVYLFEPDLSTYLPGPGQDGIATLTQARQDASVMRRLNIPGFFDYPLSKDDVQQSIALLNLLPETVAPRMKLLESGLTGDRRLIIHQDLGQLMAQIDSVPGIAGVRLWEIPYKADLYAEEMLEASERDPLIAFWYRSAWAILDAPIDMSRELSLGRWRHLHGEFSDDSEGDSEGARTLYLAQRAPEFEIDKLKTDVDLQQAYGVRRDLGMDQQQYEMQLAQAQEIMRGGKRTATYWISLIQYDDARYETAENWFSKRVLLESQLSLWEPSARYNLARCLERLGDSERVVEIYKTDGDPQEHGNRIRARLFQRSLPEKEEVSKTP